MTEDHWQALMAQEVEQLSRAPLFVLHPDALVAVREEGPYQLQALWLRLHARPKPGPDCNRWIGMKRRLVTTTTDTVVSARVANVVDPVVRVVPKRDVTRYAATRRG